MGIKRPRTYHTEFYVKPRDKAWWDVFVVNEFDDDYLQRWFRVDRALFDRLVKELDPYLKHDDTNFGPAIPVEKGVAVALNYLAHGHSHFPISDRFAIGESTAHGIVHDVCKAITRHYADAVSFPLTEPAVKVLESAGDLARLLLVCINVHALSRFVAAIRRFNLGTSTFAGCG